MDFKLIILFAVVLILAGVLFAFITLKGGKRKYLNTDKYRSQWLTIEHGLDKTNEASFQLAILNADKLLDKALRERGFEGNTMGERMKSAKSEWTKIDQVWAAHKIRNRIAHEPEFKLSYNSTRRALAVFKQALKDTGAI